MDAKRVATERNENTAETAGNDSHPLNGRDDAFDSSSRDLKQPSKDAGGSSAASGSEHVHEWKTVAHIDACHYFIWRCACECGYVYETSQERDLAFDSYSAIWMTNDDGSPMCARCEKLLNGAALLPPLEVTKPSSAVADAPGNQHRRARDGRQA